MVAFNYAYLCNPKVIFLFGYDFTINPRQRHYSDHWYGNYSWGKEKRSPSAYNKWLETFKYASEQLTQKGIQVYNVSKISRVEQFPKVDFNAIFDILKTIPQDA
jgi:hypothetical protein